MQKLDADSVADTSILPETQESLVDVSAAHRDSNLEEILDELSTETVAEGVRELDSDDAVRILEDLTQDEQTEILEQLPSRERLALLRNLDYPEESAGRRMQDEFIAVPPSWTVGRVMDYLSETAELPERFLEIYVVDPGYRLLGAVAPIGGTAFILGWLMFAGSALSARDR